MPNPEQPQPIQENLADVKEPQQNNVEGLEVAHGEELENVVDAANALAGKIERDEKVTKGEVYDLREALGQVKFDIGGEMMTIEQIKQIPDLKTNLPIFQEIQAGNLKRVTMLSFLPKNIAESLSHHHGDLYLIGLSSLSDEAAESLSHHQGDLDLRNLSSLSDASAESLSHHNGVLSLSFLSSLSDRAAESLSHHQGNLITSPKIQEQIDKFKTKK
ncbi:MAG: hypothetical protein WC663_02370 [Patescibacteria group bacterium]|jgi:methyl coenzyme M reductase subunit D